jgi:hypothetical protein
MELSKLAIKPQLIKSTLDDEDIVKEFGEPLEFYTWDRTPIDQFMKLASVDKDNYTSVLDAVTGLIMDKEGNPIINKDTSLPNNVLMKVITKVVEGLGKSQK